MVSRPSLSTAAERQNFSRISVWWDTITTVEFFSRSRRTEPALRLNSASVDEGMPSSTDAEFNRKAGSVLRERLKNSTVVIVSHQTEILEKFCRSAAVLRDGRLTMYDTLAEAKQAYDYVQ